MSRIFDITTARLGYANIADFSVRELVESYRKAGAKQRTIERNRRLDLYNGRNRTITDNTLYDAIDTRYAIETELVHRGERERLLAGWLTAEHQLASRISEARDNGFKRPELRERVNATRAYIRNETSALS
jgi:hypothetical protein